MHQNKADVPHQLQEAVRVVESFAQNKSEQLLRKVTPYPKRKDSSSSTKRKVEKIKKMASKPEVHSEEKKSEPLI